MSLTLLGVACLTAKAGCLKGGGGSRCKEEF